MTRALAWLLGALFVVLPLAHVPALRNLLALSATVLVALVLSRERRWLPLPAWIMFAWIALGTASASWSPDPSVTLHDVLYDMVFPTGVFLAAWRVAREPGTFDYLRWAACAGLFCVVAVVAFVLASGAPAVTFLPDGADFGMARYWPGVGIASTFAALILPFSLSSIVSSQPAERYAGFALLGAVIAVAVVSQNRIVWPTLLLSAVAFTAWLWPRVSVTARRIIIGLACAAVVASWVAFDHIERERQGHTVANEIRLQAWREWGAIALEKPLLGRGLGRALLTSEGRRAVSEELRQQEPAFAWHAHNLLIDIAVQLGLIGVALYVALLATLLREYWRLAGRGTPLALRTVGATGFCLLIAMLAKNSTDDFMDQAVAIAFWGYAGLLLGPLSRRS